MPETTIKPISKRTESTQTRNSGESQIDSSLEKVKTQTTRLDNLVKNTRTQQIRTLKDNITKLENKASIYALGTIITGGFSGVLGYAGASTLLQAAQFVSTATSEIAGGAFIVASAALAVGAIYTVRKAYISYKQSREESKKLEKEISKKSTEKTK